MTIVYERFMSGYREVARFQDGRRYFAPPPQRMVGDQSQLWQKPVEPPMWTNPILQHWEQKP